MIRDKVLLCVRVCLSVCVCTNAKSSKTIRRTLSKFCPCTRPPSPKPKYSFPTVPPWKLYHPLKGWKHLPVMVSLISVMYEDAPADINANFSSTQFHEPSAVGNLSIRPFPNLPFFAYTCLLFALPKSTQILLFSAIKINNSALFFSLNDAFLRSTTV